MDLKSKFSTGLLRGGGGGGPGPLVEKDYKKRNFFFDHLPKTDKCKIHWYVSDVQDIISSVMFKSGIELDEKAGDLFN